MQTHLHVEHDLVLLFHALRQDRRAILANLDRVDERDGVGTVFASRDTVESKREREDHVALQCAAALGSKRVGSISELEAHLWRDLGQHTFCASPLDEQRYSRRTPAT